MTISFKAIVPAQQRRADGTYNVKIRVTFKRASRWIPTNINVTDGDLTRSKKIKSPAVVAKCENLIADLRKIVSELSPFATEAMDVDGVVSYIKKAKTAESFRLDFFEYGDAFAAKQEGSARDAVNGALNSLERFLGCRRLDINDITLSLLYEYAEFTTNEPRVTYIRTKGVFKKTESPKRGELATWRYISRLRQVFQDARERYNDEDEGTILIPKNPFARIVLSKKRGEFYKGQRNLGPEVIQRIISARPANRRTAFALDVFVLSFCLMGVNLCDLYNAAPPVDGVWTYKRQKTRNRRRDEAIMKVKVPPQLSAILERLQDRTDPTHWLNLHNVSATTELVGSKVNAGLKRWAEEEGLEPFTLYAARHSWASIARSSAVGIDKATVDEGLAHKGTMPIADIYIDRDFDVINAANERVLSIFNF